MFCTNGYPRVSRFLRTRILFSHERGILCLSPTSLQLFICLPATINFTMTTMNTQETIIKSLNTQYYFFIHRFSLLFCFTPLFCWSCTNVGIHLVCTETLNISIQSLMYQWYTQLYISLRVKCIMLWALNTNPRIHPHLDVSFLRIAFLKYS